MKAALIAGCVVLSVLSAPAAHAAEVFPNGFFQILTCSGNVFNGRGVFNIYCEPPKGESFDLNIEMLSNKDLDRLLKVCPLKEIGKDTVGMKSCRCRVQVIAQESKDKDDTLDAIKLLHVTNKVKFSWE